MDIIGKIIVVEPEQSGTTTRGTWRRQTFVIETEEQYPKKGAFELNGERIDKMRPQIGEKVKVSYDVDAHEHNGRWYNTLRAWNIERVQ